MSCSACRVKQKRALKARLISAFLRVCRISAATFSNRGEYAVFRMRDKLPFPSDDDTADMYLFMCEYLEEHGIMQYEISNFAVPGFESRHNLKYWHDEEYLGIGASAHSF